VLAGVGLALAGLLWRAAGNLRRLAEREPSGRHQTA
jgi:hypothetical protein